MHKAILTAILLSVILLYNAQVQPTNVSPMNKINQIYPVFITDKLEETVKFYEQYFGFTRLFESTFFVLLQTAGEEKICVAFMDEGHPTTPPTPPRFNGSGSFLTLEVSDAKAEFDKLKKKGLSIYYELKDEAWGQKRFGVLDPNQIYIDVVEQIEPKEGFWDKYIKP